MSSVNIPLKQIKTICISPRRTKNSTLRIWRKKTIIDSGFLFSSPVVKPSLDRSALSSIMTLSWRSCCTILSAKCLNTAIRPAATSSKSNVLQVTIAGIHRKELVRTSFGSATCDTERRLSGTKHGKPFQLIPLPLCYRCLVNILALRYVIHNVVSLS